MSRKALPSSSWRLSGVTFTKLYGHYEDAGHPEYIWYTIAGTLLVGMLVITLFTRTAGEFKELEE